MQAIAIRRDGCRFTQLAGCIDAATDTYLLSRSEAKDIVGLRCRQLSMKQVRYWNLQENTG